jgi:hypothetical protein
VAAEGGRTLTEKSLTNTLPLTEGKLPPAKLRTALFPSGSEPEPESTVIGAVTLTLTLAAGLIVVVVVPPEVVDVVVDVFTI